MFSLKYMLLISRIALVVLFSRWLRSTLATGPLSFPSPLSLLYKILLLFVYYFVYGVCRRFEGIFLSKTKMCFYFVLYYFIFLPSGGVSERDIFILY